MIKIHYQDEFLLVVEKPSGLLTVPGKGPDKQDCLISRLKVDFPTALIVHRLDMATSGLIIVALQKKAHRALGDMFAERKVSKQYVAVVVGKLAKEEGSVDLPLICDWPNRPRQKVDHESGKPSLTHYSLMSYDKELNQTRVLLEPVTGRSHQLRVHMLSLGHCIVGDTLYGTEEIISMSPRLLLHAQSLKFTHPLTNENIELESKAQFS